MRDRNKSFTRHHQKSNSEIESVTTSHNNSIIAKKDVYVWENVLWQCNAIFWFMKGHHFIGPSLRYFCLI